MSNMDELLFLRKRIERLEKQNNFLRSHIRRLVGAKGELAEISQSEVTDIDACHPLVTNQDHDLYEKAVMMVGERHEKYELVDLVNWLLVRLRHGKDPK